MNTDLIQQFREWLESQEPPKSERTVEAYAGYVRALLPFLGPSWTNADVTQQRLAAWRDSIGQAKRRGQVSASQIRTKLAAYKAFFDFAVNVGLMRTNPARSIANYPRDEGVPRPMPVEEVEQLLRSLAVTSNTDESTVQDRAMIECFLNGLRNVEVVRLNIGDVHYDGAAGTVVLRVVGKGRVPGLVPLNVNAASFVVRHLLQSRVVAWQSLVRQEGITALFRAYHQWWQRNSGLHTQPVFFKHAFQRLSRQDVNAMFRARRDRAGVGQTYGPHSLRHTCATQLLNRGVDLRVVQSILRHKNIAQTCLYAAVATETQTRAMQVLPTAGAAV